jgi:hypothetical protein
LFHNHLTFDLVKAVFDFPTPQFGRLAEAIRLATFEAAARDGLAGLIYTLVYAAPEDDPFIEKTIAMVERHGGELAFVRLYCESAEHEQRVRSADRQRFGKITSAKALREALSKWNLGAAVPYRESLEIDTTSVPADVVARRIVERLSLPLRA